MNFKKLMKDLDLTTVLVVGVAVVAILYMLNQYSAGKAAAVDTMKDGENAAAAAPANSSVEECTSECYNVAPASAGGASGAAPGGNGPTMNAADLLPKDANSEWAQSANVSADLQGVNLLSAGKHLGINTVGTSLRNANLQLRPEPANPRFDVGPFLNSTIDSNVDPRSNNPLVA